MSTAIERRPDEVRALSRLSFEELASAAGGIGGMHSAIAGRVFRYVGGAGRPGADGARHDLRRRLRRRARGDDPARPRH